MDSGGIQIPNLLKHSAPTDPLLNAGFCPGFVEWWLFSTKFAQIMPISTWSKLVFFGTAWVEWWIVSTKFEQIMPICTTGGDMV
jgi:hypothetical protein